ncbi:MAG: 50S ribosomal protein L6, partial [Pirellulaceae bacterium]|nr:50S ribosomal protein L6 [Pirellulaceae bacterium]
MSRIGKKPVDVLDGVKVNIENGTVNVEGPKGKLQWQIHPEVTVELDEGGKTVSVARRDDERTSRALHGLTRAVINNMI